MRQEALAALFGLQVSNWGAVDHRPTGQLVDYAGLKNIVLNSRVVSLKILIGPPFSNNDVINSNDVIVTS